MNLKITKNIKEANLITHGSTFHPDDVFATAFLSKFIENPIVCRTNYPNEVPTNAIIYDIGFGKFDHHGPDALYRENSKLKYCSFGLLWREYGLSYLKSITNVEPEKLFLSIDEKLIMQIDGIDNGIFPKIEAEYKLTDLDKIIDLFNKAWNEDADNDDNFLIAVNIASRIFDRFIKKEQAKIVANNRVENLIPESKDGILILDEYMPYQEAIFSSTNPQAKEIKVVIFPSNRGGYSIKPMTISKESKELAYHFNLEYNGLHDEELAKISNIKTARFVHASGFLACTETLEDAILLAKNAISHPNDNKE